MKQEIREYHIKTYYYTDIIILASGNFFISVAGNIEYKFKFKNSTLNFSSFPSRCFVVCWSHTKIILLNMAAFRQ